MTIGDQEDDYLILGPRLRSENAWNFFQDFDKVRATTAFAFHADLLQLHLAQPGQFEQGCHLVAEADDPHPACGVAGEIFCQVTKYRASYLVRQPVPVQHAHTGRCIHQEQQIQASSIWPRLAAHSQAQGPHGEAIDQQNNCKHKAEFAEATH